MGVVTASLVINYATLAAGARISMELDSDLNDGRSTFSAGDTAYFRVYSNVDFALHTTAGTVVKGALTTGSVEDNIQFVQEREVTVSKEIVSIGSVTWFGANGGEVTRADEFTVRIPTAGIFIGKLDYTSHYYSCRLSGITIPDGLDEFPILVVAAQTS